MSKRKILNIVLFVVFVLSVFSLGFFIGIGKNISSSLVNSSGNVDITKVLNLYGKSRSDKVDFNQYWDIWNKIKKNMNSINWRNGTCPIKAPISLMLNISR